MNALARSVRLVRPRPSPAEFGNRETTADLAAELVGDFGVAWHCLNLTGLRVDPKGV